MASANEPDPSQPTLVRPDPPAPSKRGWIAGGIAVVAIVVIGLVGLKLVTGSSSTRTATVGGTPTTAGPGGGVGPGGRGRGATGTVASIAGDTFTLTTSSGTTKVVTNATTTFTTTTSGALSDLKVGDNVAVQGATTDTTVAATRITDSGAIAAGGFGRGGAGFGGNGGGSPPTGQAPPPGQAPNGQDQPGGARGRPVIGTVSALAGTTVTVKAANGTAYTVTTTPSTTVALVKPSSLSALQVGQTVRATGMTADDGTVTAASVREGVTAGGPPGP